MEYSESSCLRVFGIPELAGIICGLVRKSDNASLLRVCRRLFYDVCPFVWETTDAVVSIAPMIPGCGVVLVDGHLPPEAVMQFPSTLDLSRLQLYAPYVRNLEIPHQLLVDRYENWDGFLSATRSISLLPNLEHISLSLEAVKPVDISEETVNWVTVFLSASLLSVSIASRAPPRPDFNPNYAFVEFELAHRLLDDISKKCPRFDSLKLFIGRKVVRPDGFWLHLEFAEDFVLNPWSDILSILSRFRSLRTLAITPLGQSDDAFIALARLPLLESLTVYSLRSNRHVYGQDLTLPDDSFPSLWHLNLELITWESIFNLFRQASIWKGLRSFRIRGISASQPHERNNDPHLLPAIILNLADQQAPISTLSIAGAARQSISAQTAESLKRLPLTNLSLDSFDLDRSDLQSILGALQLLEELEICIYFGYRLPQLGLIVTSLPRLRNLSLPMNSGALDDLGIYEIIPPRTQSQDRFCLASDIRLPEPQHESADKIARYLYALNPNMIYTCSRSLDDVRWRGTDVLINEALSRLREASVGGE